MDQVQSCEANQESNQLIELALEGDRDALDKLLASSRARVYRHALRILGNREDAEDALQEAFLNVFRHFQQFQGRSQFSTWLTRIVINAAHMIQRSKNRRLRESSLEDWPSDDEGQTRTEIADLRPNPEHIYSSSELLALLNRQFNRLSPGTRTAFQLRHVDGLTCEAVGHSMGISVPAVKSRARRAKLQLAENLSRAYRGPGTRTAYDVLAPTAAATGNAPHSIAG